MTSLNPQQFYVKIYPLSYVLKYDPPMIGMVYKLKESDPKKRLYKIYLHSLIYKNDAEAITRQLFQEHALHINQNNVSHEQMKNLVTKLLQTKEKQTENSSGEKKENPTKESAEIIDLLGLDEPQAQPKAEIQIQDFRQSKNNQRIGQYKYSPQDIDDEHLEIEGEDLENDENIFHYDKLSKKVPAANQQNNDLDFLNTFGHQKVQEEHDMDFILDDPDNLENLSDY